MPSETPLWKKCAAAFAAAAAGAYVFVRWKRSRTVCVTGANGYLASELVRQLLERGFFVRGTVRALTPDRVDHLRKLPGAARRLTLVCADLAAPAAERDAAFDAAVAGCCCVFHTASPFFLGQPSAARGDSAYDEATMLVPAVEGTRAVLSAAARAKTVRRVVVTASTASVYCRTGLAEDHVFTEADWSGADALRAHGDWYALSKTLAERAAWDFVASWSKCAADAAAGDAAAGERAERAISRSAPPQPPFALVVMNPTLIVGPALQPRLNQSLETVLRLLDGSKRCFPTGSKAFVDVRDVAEAHVRAHATGAVDGQRVLLIGDCVPWARVCEVLRDAAPGAPVPAAAAAAGGGALAMVPSVLRYDCARAERALGVKFRGIEEMLRASVATLEAHGHWARLSDSVVVVPRPVA